MTRSDVVPGRRPGEGGSDWKRLRPLLERLLELPASEHAAFLARECGDDGELALELRRMVAVERGADRFLDPPTLAQGAAGPGETPGLSSGDRIGPYRLAEPLGEGGMGTVWLAERDEGGFEQRVAIKLIKQGFHTEEVLTRFENERQVLAWLEHPSIARLLDGGRLENGLPYLVMEHVDGVPIDRYCDARGASLKDRVQLFLEVCDAVRHAHERGVVHRDLKPSNVLVDGSGRPRLLDFGIAKVLGAESADESFELTRTGQRLYSPHYASPEQVRGEPVTAASDVYSLGVVLYELLTGERPYRERGVSQYELERVVCEEEPVRPSRAERDATRTGHAEPWRRRGLASARELRSRLAGDLDWILLACLRKDPGRRYGSVAELAEDLHSHLAHRPVRARPESWRYRSARFVRRNPVLTAAAATLFGVISIALAITAQLLSQTRTAEAESNLEALVSQLQAAEAAIRDTDLEEARALLQRTGPEDRGWEWRHLVARTERGSRVPLTAGQAQDHLAFDPRSGFFAVASWSHVILFDPLTGETHRSESLPTEERNGGTAQACFHPHDEILIAGLGDYRVHLFDARTLAPLRRLEWTGVRGIGLSPDGKRLALVNEDGKVLIASWPELELEQTFPGAIERPDLVRFAPNGTTLAVAGWDEDVQLFELTATGARAGARLGGHTMEIRSLAFDSNGTRLATASLDQTVRLWPLDRAEPSPLVFRQHGSGLTAVQFHPVDDTVLSLDQNGLGLRWDPENAEVLQIFRGEQNTGALGVAADGSWIVSSSASAGTLQIWPGDTDDIRRLYSCEFSNRVVFDRSGESILCSAPDGRIRRWDLEEPDQPLVVETGLPLRLVSPSGADTLLSVNDEGRLDLWSETLAPLSSQLVPELVPRAHHPVHSHGSLTALSAQGSVVVHDAELGQIVARLAPEELVGGLLWLEEGELLLVTGSGSLSSWRPGHDSAARPVTRVVNPRPNSPWAFLARIPDSRNVVLAFSAAGLFLVDADTGRTVTLEEEPRSHRSLAAHPTEPRLAVGYADGSIGLWDLDRRRELVQLHGHRGAVRDLAFSPDGTLLASCSDDGWVRLWDAPSPDE